MDDKDESDLVMVSNESETDSNPTKRQGTLLSFFNKSHSKKKIAIGNRFLYPELKCF
jgi:hypothetical protein